MRKSLHEAPRKEEPPPDLQEKFPAGIRIQKLRLALSIMGIGMVVALMWHGFQGWVLENGYPYNTFLFNPDVSYTDFLNARKSAGMDTPYAINLPDGYTPASYAVFYRVFTWFRPLDGFLLFLFGGLFGIITVSIYVLHPIAREQILAMRDKWNRQRMRSRTQSGRVLTRPPKLDFPAVYGVSLLYALSLVFLSFPVWSVIDRANNEIFIALFIGIALVALNHGRYILGFAWLIPCICFKMYPAVLLALFLRRGKLLWIASTGVIFFFINWFSLLSFSTPVAYSLNLEHRGMLLMYNDCIIGNWGMAGSTSPWNALKLVLEWFYYQGDGSPESIEANRLSLVPLFKVCLVYFEACIAVGAVGVTIYTFFIEKEYLRKVVVLLLFMVMAGPYGGDYKFLHVLTALMAMLLVRTRRPGDLIVIALLAFILIPKKEMLIPFAGITDSGCRDVSVAIFLNPIAMLTVMAYVARDGLKHWNRDWAIKRFQILLSSVKTPWLGIRVTSPR